MDHPIIALRRLLTGDTSGRAIGVVSSVKGDTAVVSFGKERKVVNSSGLQLRLGDSVLVESGNAVHKVSPQDSLPLYHL